MKPAIVNELIELFREAEKNYNQQDSEEGDVDWAAWHAEEISDRLTMILDEDFDEEELAEILQKLYEAHQEKDPEADWKEFFAEWFVKEYTDGEDEE